MWNVQQMKQSDRRSAHRKLLGMTLNTYELFWTLRNVTVMLTTKWILLQFLSQKHSFRQRQAQRKCLRFKATLVNIQKWQYGCQPEILKSRELWQMEPKFQWQIWGLDHGQLEVSGCSSLRERPTTGNGNVAAETGNTYINLNHWTFYVGQFAAIARRKSAGRWTLLKFFKVQSLKS